MKLLTNKKYTRVSSKYIKQKAKFKFRLKNPPLPNKRHAKQCNISSRKPIKVRNTSRKIANHIYILLVQIVVGKGIWIPSPPDGKSEPDALVLASLENKHVHKWMSAKMSMINRAEVEILDINILLFLSPSICPDITSQATIFIPNIVC